MKRQMLPISLFCSCLLLVPVSVSAQYGPIPVIDAANLIQNIEQVLRIIEEIRILTKQLEDMLKNSRTTAGVWEQALPLLDRLGGNIAQGMALAYKLQELDGTFRVRFPGFIPPQDWQREYGIWTSTTLDTLRTTLTSLQLHDRDFLDSTRRIAAIAAISDSAVGRMQAIQTTNMLAAEIAQQLVKLRQLSMMQINAQNTWMAKTTNEEAQIDAFTREWLLNAKKPVPVELRTRMQRALSAGR